MQSSLIMTANISSFSNWIVSYKRKHIHDPLIFTGCRLQGRCLPSSKAQQAHQHLGKLNCHHCREHRQNCWQHCFYFQHPCHHFQHQHHHHWPLTVFKGQQTSSSRPKTAHKRNIRVQAKIEYLAPLLMQMNNRQILNYWWFAFTEICFQFFTQSDRSSSLYWPDMSRLPKIWNICVFFWKN